jgi:hypothetical protein
VSLEADDEFRHRRFCGRPNFFEAVFDYGSSIHNTEYPVVVVARVCVCVCGAGPRLTVKSSA